MKEFELTFEDVMNARKKIQKSAKANAHVVNGDIVESREEIAEEIEE